MEERTKRDVLNYGLQVRGIFGRNRKVTFKTPDARYNALATLREEHGADGEYEEECVLLDKFVRYGEYVRIEFDSESGTARVLEVREV